MWKVNNNTNINKLKIFQKKVIYPLFIELLYYKKNYYKNFYIHNNKLELSKFVSNEQLLKHSNNKPILNFLFSLKHKKQLFIDYIDIVTRTQTLGQLFYYFSVYRKQNYQLNNHINPSHYDIPKEYKIIFVDFFYEKLFNNSKLWNLIDKSDYSRKQFHENFVNDNNLLVCPYCDIDTIINSGNKQIEHFWPKSKYPFLSMNGYNLISSCHSCNMPAEGKGINTYDNIVTPFSMQIGDNVSFTLNPSCKKVDIYTSDQKVENYLNLLNLHIRYESTSIYTTLRAKGEAIFSTILDMENITHVKLNASEIQEYIYDQNLRTSKIDPLYFARRDIYKNFNLYNNYRAK